MTKQEWRRPEGLALPTVWCRFKGTRAMADGRVPDFWIQCVRPQDDAIVLELMQNHFLEEEELSRVLNVSQCPESIAELRGMWIKLLEQRVSLAAWTTWPDATPRLVAVNILCVRTKNDPKYEGKADKVIKTMRALNAMDSKVDMFARHGVTEYLTAMGLTALPEFRGQGLGLELLRARVPLCRALGLRFTGTIFTGIGSQKQSARAGFQTVAEMRYKDYVDEGKVVFADAGPETMELKELVVPTED